MNKGEQLMKWWNTDNGLFDIGKPPRTVEEVHAIEANVNYRLYLQEYRSRLEEALKNISKIGINFLPLYEEHRRLAAVCLCNLGRDPANDFVSWNRVDPGTEG